MGISDIAQGQCVEKVEDNPGEQEVSGSRRRQGKTEDRFRRVGSSQQRRELKEESAHC